MIERHEITSTEDWLSERLRWINASEMPIVCGEAHYSSLAELYAEKKGLRPPLVDSAAFRRGRWGEAAVFQALAEERPQWQVHRARVHVRDTVRRIACTPDGFALAPGRDGIGVVQAKVVARSIARGWMDGDEEMRPPVPYVLQTLTEMMLNGSQWGVLAVLVNGEFSWELLLFDIERNPVIEENIYACAARFWREHLDPNIMPPFEPQRDAELLKLLYPEDNGAEIDLSGDNRALVVLEELIETKKSIRRMEKQEDNLKTELQAKLGEHTLGRFADGRRISWKKYHREEKLQPAAAYRIFKVLASKQAAAEG